MASSQALPSTEPSGAPLTQDEIIKELEESNLKLKDDIVELQSQILKMKESERMKELIIDDLRDRLLLIEGWVLSYTDNSERGQREFRARAVAENPGWGPIIDFVRAMEVKSGASSHRTD